MGRQLILEIFCLLAALYAADESLAIGHNSDGDYCKTPDNWEGECVDIKDCSALSALSEKENKSANETSFLQQSICGRGYLVVYVCCRFKVTELLPDTRHCGQYFQDRIFGGSSTHFYEYPWTAVIEFKDINDTIYLCGGTLINNRYVLTAAHCSLFREVNVNEEPVRLGEWNLTTDPDCRVSKNGIRSCADPHLDFGIEEFIIHPNFTFEEFAPIHDIALIRLNRYVNFTDFIQPVCLPLQPRLRSKTYVGTSMTAIGWGSTETSVFSTVKQKVYLPGVNLDVCRRQYNRIRIRVLDTHLCAGGENGEDVCSGDSGGQLVIQQNVDFRDVYVLVGISSFGFKPCGRNGWPGVFIRVGAYIDWIQDNLKP